MSKRKVFAILSLALAAAAAAACSPEVDPDACDGVGCSGHGFCEVEDGAATCLCEAGYHDVGTECVVDPISCDATSCSGHGDCDDSTGAVVCSCDTGYRGDYCSECDEGYEREGGPSGGTGDCVLVDDPCDPDPCDGHDCGNGSCSCVDGAAACACDAGYTGDACDECDTNYHRLDAEGDCLTCNTLRFTFEAAGATTVWLTGTFAPFEDRWAHTPAEGAFEMTNTGGSWTADVVIATGGEHEYKYIVDSDDWRHDSNQPTTDDGQGGFNNVIDVCNFGGDLETPDWRDVVMYFVMVDRFDDGDGFVDEVAGATSGPPDGASGQYMGGDLEGVTHRMDYLDDLGVTAIWLSAPYDNRDAAGAAIDSVNDTNMYSGYHGYWPSPANVDYSDPDAPSPVPAVESRIGTAADLRELVDAAHATPGANGGGVRVLFDYVMNHVDINSGLYAAHNDWFARREGNFALCGPENLWDDAEWGVKCAFTDYLPPFDFGASSAARQWSVADALWWATEFGIDGYRLDAIKHVPFAWLTDLRAALNSRVSDPWGDRFYLVGETFAYDNAELIRDYVNPESMLDGQFDFPFKARLCEAAFTEGGGLNHLSSWMDSNDSFYGSGALMTTWIGNHDIPRAIHFASRQIGNCRQGSDTGNGWSAASYPQPTDGAPYGRLGVAFAIMMTNPGIPLIYYGDEIGLAGGGDPDNRRMMVFEDAELNSHQIALRERVSTLGTIRATNRALTRGRRTTRSVDQNTWVFTMSVPGGGAPDVTVAINRAGDALDVTIPSGNYTDLVTDTAHAGGSVSLPAYGMLILRHE